MVNNKLIILNLLKAAPLSGDELSAETGISRVAVWKNIQSLISEGYPIIASKKGYCLQNDFDLINDYEMAVHDIRVTHLKSTTSTMKDARAAGNRWAVFADEQTEGCGRFGRQWSSQKGGLYFTVNNNVNIPARFAFLVTLAASYAAAEAAQGVSGIETSIKWPNDVFAGTKKIAGILCEITTDFTVVSSVASGIGINANNNVPLKTATSLKNINGKTVSKKLLADSFLSIYLPMIESFNPVEIRDKWKSKNVTIGKRVSAVGHDFSFDGVASDISLDGSLIIVDGKKEIVFNYGDLRHLQ